MKNTTRIGSSLLGTWSAEVQLSDHHHDSLSAYFLVHFMADPRKSHGCSLADCSEVDNQVCMMEADPEGIIHDRCQEIAKQTDVSWSDLNAFFYFGVKVDSESKPKAKFELSTGEWIGPFNILMAQDEVVPFGVNNSTMVDRYVGRYVQSQSTMPVFLQNRMPLSSTLYHKPNDYAAFLGHSALSFMTKSQTNYSISANDTTIQNDPYAPYYQNCTLGDVQPILPLIELEYFDDSSNNTSNKTNVDDLEMALRLQYKIMAVPSPDERAYRVLPQLQNKFQGQGAFNIIGGPYCYQQDDQRGWSLDLTLDSQHNGTGVEFVRGCLPGLSDIPCVPPAAMGGIPIRQANHTCSHDVEPSKVFASNVVLMVVAYTLGVALLLSLMGQHWQDGPSAKRRSRAKEPQVNDEEGGEGGNNNWMHFMKEIGEAAKKPFAGLSDDAPLSNSVNPFGDLDPEEEAKEDPLQQPLLPSTDTPAEQDAEAKKDEEEAK